MMRKIHVLAGLAIVVLAVVGAAWIVISPSWAIGFIQDKVGTAVGRKLNISGGAHLQLVPALAIRLDGASIAGSSGMEGEFISAPSLLVPVTLGGLLTHRLDLAQITLNEPEINLTIDGIGRMSWSGKFVPATADARFYLNNAKISFLDQRTEQTFALAAANLAIEQSPTGEVTLDGTAIINDQLARIQAYVKDLARVSGEGSPAELTLRAPPLAVSFNGRLATSNGLGLAGTATLSGADLRQALKWVGASTGGTLGLKAFKLSGSLDAAGRVFGMLGADFTIDDVAGRGDVALDFRRPIPKLQAIAAAEAINLDKYIPQSGRTSEEWGTLALGFPAWRGLDGAVTIETKNLTYSGLALGPTKVAAMLAAGRLEAQFVSGTSSAINLTLDGSGPIGEFALSYSGSNVDAARILGPLAGIAWLDGKGLLSANVSGTGNTQQEIVSTLKGETHVALAGGVLRGLDISAALAGVAREVQDGWPATGAAATPFATLNAGATIADGIATIQNLTLDSPALAMAGTGEIDLLRRSLDLRVDPRLVTRANTGTIGLPVAVVVKGPWRGPRIYPDLAEAITNPTAAYEALHKLGLPPPLGSAGGN